MSMLTDYIVGVIAGVASYYICKWFDHHNKR